MTPVEFLIVLAFTLVTLLAVAGGNPVADLFERAWVLATAPLRFAIGKVRGEKESAA